MKASCQSCEFVPLSVQSSRDKINDIFPQQRDDRLFLISEPSLLDQDLHRPLSVSIRFLYVLYIVKVFTINILTKHFQSTGSIRPSFACVSDTFDPSAF